MILHVTDSSFDEEVLNADQPVLLDVWTEWCGACKGIAPILEEVAVELRGKLKIAKLNCDENPRTRLRFGVRGMPAFLLFKRGRLIGQKLGAVRKPDLLALLHDKLNELA